MKKRIIQVNDKVPLAQAIPLSIQHLFAMFGASVAVPLALGIDPGIVLLMNGFGTLLFMVLTKGKAPAYLGSSFAYIAPALLVMGSVVTSGLAANTQEAFQYAQGGFVVSGVLFCIIAAIIKFCGTKWIDIILPPAAMGPIVALIGLELAGTTVTSIIPTDGNAVAPEVVIVFLITLGVAVFGSVLFRKFFAVIPILMAIIIGYIAAVCFGIVDFTVIQEAEVFSFPKFQLPIFDINAILTILPATLVVVSEHIGHQIVTGKVIERDLIKDPGLHRSMLGDGLSSAISGFVGSVPTTTYGENIGVMAMTGVYNVKVIAGAAVISMILSFVGVFSAAIQTIPEPVMNGICFMLYGMIAASGLRIMVEAQVDFSKAKNLALAAVVFVTGLSGVYVQIGDIQIKGMALATIVGMILGLLFYLFDKFRWSNELEDEDSKKEPSQQ